MTLSTNHPDSPTNGVAPATDRQATYYDESGERHPAYRRACSDATDGHVSVYGDHFIGSFGSVNMEVRGGRLFLYAMDGDDVDEVAFTLEESRAVLRAASHMLVSNTMASVRVLDAEPEMVAIERGAQHG